MSETGASYTTGANFAFSGTDNDRRWAVAWKQAARCWRNRCSSQLTAERQKSARLEATIERLLRALCVVDGCPMCPECGMPQGDDYHSPDCPIGLVLREKE